MKPFKFFFQLSNSAKANVKLANQPGFITLKWCVLLSCVSGIQLAYFARVQGAYL